MKTEVHPTIIDQDYLIRLLAQTKPPGPKDFLSLLDKAHNLQGLSLPQVTQLILADFPGTESLLYKAAGEVKRKVFGRRIVLFAPLYLSNECTNDCLYCGFRRSNFDAPRTVLEEAEAVAEARELVKKGFKRVLLVFGEHPQRAGIDYMESMVGSLYRHSGMRIVHVNAAPMSEEEFYRLKASGVGVYQLFQETYHQPTYETMHPAGRKKDYLWRLHAMDRALAGGFKDLGLGVLFGLYDWRFEVLGLVAHAQYLKEHFGTWPHTVSVPRLQPAAGSLLTQAPWPVADEDFKRIVALLRLSLPSVGIVVTTREPARLRDEIIFMGASQISAGSRTDPGGYRLDKSGRNLAQFSVHDQRSLEEVLAAVMEGELLPSLCTACYRVGRTGGDFHQHAERGEYVFRCTANGILTLQEYLLDTHPPGELVQRSQKAIEEGLKELAGTPYETSVRERLKKMAAGERDLFF